MSLQISSGIGSNSPATDARAVGESELRNESFGDGGPNPASPAADAKKRADRMPTCRALASAS